MKKLVLFVTMLFSSVLLTFAQDNIVLYISDCPSNLTLCSEHNQTVTIYSKDGCNNFEWYVNTHSMGNIDPLVISPTNGSDFIVHYNGYDCDFFYHFDIMYRDYSVPTAFTHDAWKRLGSTVEIEAMGTDSIYGYSFQWNTGETTSIIEVSQTGTYTCEISSVCGSTTRTFIVKDNVEIVSASVDPGTNKNLVTWDVTPEQATYISNVIVNRDGVDMATVPYTNGQFLDNIGSDLAARIYTIVGVCPDGTLCPIQSLSRGTIHMAFLPDINGNVEMTWNQPELGGADIHVGRFEICEYDPNSNEINVIDFVSSVTTSYSCNLSMFDYGYPLIRAVIQDGRGERDILSNRTNEIVGQPHEITINLKPGWTWISYPYAVVKSFASAMGDFVPMEGDIIKSQFGNSSYHNGQWRGNVQQFIPGFGYMYFSTRTAPTTLVFDLSSSRR